MTVTSFSFSISSRARFHPTLPAPATITYTSGPRRGGVAECGLLELLDRDRGRADRVQPLLLVPARAARVEHAHDHLLDTEAAPGDLRDDEVRVVAVGGGDEDVGVLDAGLDERVHLERGADREAPA